MLETSSTLRLRSVVFVACSALGALFGTGCGNSSSGGDSDSAAGSATNNAIIAAHVTVAANPNLGPDASYTDVGPHIGVAFKVDNKSFGTLRQIIKPENF